MYEVMTKFRVGDQVRIDADCTYFDASVRGRAMTVLEIDRFRVDGKEVIQYTTNLLDPVLCTPYNEDELVAANPPLPPRD